MASITSANAVYLLAITGLFDVPQHLQGYAADDIFSTDAVSSAEIAMGMDGILSAGYVPAPVAQGITLQANSESAIMFDEWYGQQRLIRDIYYAQATIVLTSLGRKWSMVNGVLTNYPPMPDAARTLRPRRFTITWESAQPQNV